MAGVHPCQAQSSGAAAAGWRPIPAIFVSILILTFAYAGLPLCAGRFPAVVGIRAVGLSLVQQVSIVVLVIAAAASKGGNATDVLSLKAGHDFRDWMLAAIAAPAFLAAAMLALRLTFAGLIGIVLPTAASALDWMLIAFTFVAAVPVAEEMLFRGFLLAALSDSRFGFWGGAAVTSAFWAGMHFLNVGYGWLPVALIFMGGLGLSYLRRRSGTLWSCIVAHGCYNALPTAAILGLAG